MIERLQNLKKYREFLLDQISDLTTNQLNEIPPGFSNNIIWNLGHIISATQGICYKRSGLEIKIDEKYFTPFLTNTKPENFVSGDEIEIIKSLLIQSIDVMHMDYTDKLFVSYIPSENIERVYGIRLMNIDDAFEFLQYHDGLHSGCILTLKHLV